MSNEVKTRIMKVIQAHDVAKISDYACADQLKRLIEQYFREPKE